MENNQEKHKYSEVDPGCLDIEILLRNQGVHDKIKSSSTISMKQTGTLLAMNTDYLECFRIDHGSISNLTTVEFHRDNSAIFKHEIGGMDL